MKHTLLKRKIQTCYLRGGLLMLAVCFLLVSTKLVRAADTRIAFMSTRNSDNGEIFLMNPNGSRVRQLTRHLQYDALPAWSPDGQKITFKSFRDEHQSPGSRAINGEIYVMNSDGTNLINLTQSPNRSDGLSCWSPDGKQIAFKSAEISKKDGIFQSDVWVMDADGGNPHNLTNHDALDRAPDWAPDGNQIVFESNRNLEWVFKVPPAWNWEIYVMNADGTNPINLTNHPAADNSPDWSPDGTQIVFSSNRDGDWERDLHDNWEIYLMNADGTNLTNLTNHPAADTQPDWSLDGLRIVFSSNRDGDWERNPKDNWEVFVMNADGTNPINLTNHPKWDSQPLWEPVPTLSVSSKGKLATLWGKVKHTNTYGGN